MDRNDIRNDGVHPNLTGIQKLVSTLRDYFKSLGHHTSSTQIAMRQMKKSNEMPNVHQQFQSQWHGNQQQMRY